MDDDFLLELYRLAREAGPHAFVPAAIRRLRGRLRFDSAFWCEGDLPAKGGVVPIAVHVDDIDPDFLRDWAVANIDDPMIEWGKRCPGRAQRVDVSRFYSDTPEIVALGERHAMRSLSIVNAFTAGGRTGEWISLFRPDADATGPTDELVWLERLMPHFQEARRIHQLLQGDVGGAPGPARAVADRQNGDVLRADDAFDRLLAREWTGFDGRRVPTPLRAAWAGKPRFAFAGRTMNVAGSTADSVVLMPACPVETMASITARQRQIATLSARGWTYKEIAATLRLSPATVRNHLAAVYATLDVHSRRELAQALAQALESAAPGERRDHRGT